MQSAFRDAMLDPATAAPQGLRDGQGRPAGKRFDVYRNNVAVSLTEALEAAFPVVRKLVGDDFFRAMAGVFLRAHPPTSPLMMHYGAAFPDFVAGFDPAKGLPYLPDMARLEQALRRSYHAADATPVPADALGQIPPEDLESLRFSWAPAMQIVASPYPIVSIWQRNSDLPTEGAATGPETALITRPGFDPRVRRVPNPASPVLVRLIAGDPLGEALDAAGDGFDLAALLGLILSEATVTGLATDTHSAPNQEVD